MGFSRQEYWSGLPFPSPGDLPNPGTEPKSPALQTDALLSEPPGNPLKQKGACLFSAQLWGDARYLRVPTLSVARCWDWGMPLSVCRSWWYLQLPHSWRGVDLCPVHHLSPAPTSPTKCSAPGLYWQGRLSPCCHGFVFTFWFSTRVYIRRPELSTPTWCSRTWHVREWEEDGVTWALRRPRALPASLHVHAR